MNRSGFICFKDIGLIFSRIINGLCNEVSFAVFDFEFDIGSRDLVSGFGIDLVDRKFSF